MEVGREQVGGHVVRQISWRRARVLGTPALGLGVLIQQETLHGCPDALRPLDRRGPVSIQDPHHRQEVKLKMELQ